MTDDPRTDPERARTPVQLRRPTGAAEPRDLGLDPASLAAAVPGLVRLAVGTAVRVSGWGLRSSLRAGARLVEAATSGESVGHLIQDVATGARREARGLLGLDEDASIPLMTSGLDRLVPRSDDHAEGGPSLREQGAALLARSADVDHDEASHPAYRRILEDLAADEARILRLLAAEGPEPSVDVRTGGPLTFNSTLVAAGLSMIDRRAGCRHADRVPAYLNNLERLGLVWFSREPVADPQRYQVLEAQPDVLAALEEAGRGARTVRRSIHLTPFGLDFCRTCLPVDVSAAAAEAATPPDDLPLETEEDR